MLGEITFSCDVGTALAVLGSAILFFVGYTRAARDQRLATIESHRVEQLQSAFKSVARALDAYIPGVIVGNDRVVVGAHKVLMDVELDILLLGTSGQVEVCRLAAERYQALFAKAQGLEAMAQNLPDSASEEDRGAAEKLKMEALEEMAEVLRSVVVSLTRTARGEYLEESPSEVRRVESAISRRWGPPTRS